MFIMIYRQLRKVPTMSKIITVKANITWQAKKSDTSSRWIGMCEALDLVTEADSLDELHSLIPEAMHLLMIDLLEDDEFDAYLSDRGWAAHDIPQKPSEDVEFFVPWQLIAEGANGSARQVA